MGGGHSPALGAQGTVTLSPRFPAPLHLSPFSPSDRDRWVDSPALSERPRLYINRRLAMEHRACPLRDPACKNAVFTQVWSPGVRARAGQQGD